ncbi:MAG: spermidine synthase, partial [Ktedonobacteraceae bacterium]
PWQYKEPFYRRVYQIFPGSSFHHALILGAGSGSDTATALAYGVQSITAVEIDPTILQLGKQFNPDQPYSNPRVKLVANDGRNFLENTTERYDLIIFALPDSLTLTSSNTSLRLESFLLTQNSIAAARAHLTSNGLLILYNFYRTNWLVDKLVNMVGHTFNHEPFVSTYGGRGRGAVIMDGPRLASLPPGEFGQYHEDPNPGTSRLRMIGEGFYPLSSNSTPATDDWPFLYLVGHSFPLIYIEGLAMVIMFALAGTLTLAPRKVLRRFDWHMFFLGAAFMLLEVKSLSTFSLLFGSTWLVNSLVFFAILSSVLLAILVNRRLKIKRIAPIYLLLFGILILNILLPPEALLLSNPVVRYILASALAFTPVFLANIIFTNSFRDSETADIAFASNLLGIMVGGGLEYFSMLIGYRLLLIPVIVFYALALLLRSRSGQKAQGQEAEAGVSAEVA